MENPETVSSTAEETTSVPVAGNSASDAHATSDANKNAPPPAYTGPQQPAPVAPMSISNNQTETTTGQQQKLNAPATTNPQQPLTVTPLTRLGEIPAWIDCPFCQQRARTRVQKENSSTTGMAACLCCLFGGIICTFLPFVLGCCQDTDHYCTACGRKVAHKPHDGPAQAHEALPPRLVVSQHAVPAGFTGQVQQTQLPQEPSVAVPAGFRV